MNHFAAGTLFHRPYPGRDGQALEIIRNGVKVETAPIMGDGTEPREEKSDEKALRF